MAPGYRCRSSQTGVTTVEFAIVGVVFFIVLFGVIEFGRALFVVNTLTEATERGARMAVVCPLGSTAPASAAIFGNGGSTSPIVYGLSTGNIVIEYLDSTGAVLADPGGSYGSIRYVRARISGFSMPLFIPLIAPTLTPEGFQTTLPRESLGITQTATEAC
jgi:Flp pilus assembly protein TadG